MSRAKPYLKFYPADWRADPALRLCSLAARGLWLEMLCIMHETMPYGYLTINGHVMADEQLAVQVIPAAIGCALTGISNLALT